MKPEEVSWKEHFERQKIKWRFMPKNIVCVDIHDITRSQPEKACLKQEDLGNNARLFGRNENKEKRTHGDEGKTNKLRQACSWDLEQAVQN
jgi:hypothetical protein